MVTEADTGAMTTVAPVAPTPELESAILSAALVADSARAGARAFLSHLLPLVGDCDVALVVRDRDGQSLQVLAQTGSFTDWPDRLAPQFSLGADGVDRATHTWVAPLRADDRVLGALVLADPSRGAAMSRDARFARAVEMVARGMWHLIERTDVELRRRADAMRSVDTVAEGVGHQIANPLSGASAIAQLLTDELTDAGHRAALRQIQKELGRALAVVDDLLAVHRDTGAQDGILDLGPFVERLLRFSGYSIREAGISLVSDVAPGFMGVRADARGVEHALLIALRFAEQRARAAETRAIIVRVAPVGTVGFEVKITASGSPAVPAIAPKYFELPLRTPDLVDAESGDEVDLGLVRSILRGCGGFLEASGSPAQGTTLTLAFPRASVTPPTSRAVPP